MYKRQVLGDANKVKFTPLSAKERFTALTCLLYTSDAADDSLRVDLGGRRIIKKKGLLDVVFHKVFQDFLMLMQREIGQVLTLMYVER